MKKKKPSSLEEKRFDKMHRELDAIFKNIPGQRATIAKNRGSKGWSKGYTAAWGARKVIRKTFKRSV